MNPADVLEAAADALFVYGRCRGVGADRDGRMCVRGAVRYALGLDPFRAMCPQGEAREVDDMLAVYLATHPKVLGEAGERYPDWVERGSFPTWAWNDEVRDDELVIDTLRRCAKDVRNGEA